MYFTEISSWFSPAVKSGYNFPLRNGVLKALQVVFNWTKKETLAQSKANQLCCRYRKIKRPLHSSIFAELMNHSNKWRVCTNVRWCRTCQGCREESFAISHNGNCSTAKGQVVLVGYSRCSSHCGTRTVLIGMSQGCSIIVLMQMRTFIPTTAHDVSARYPSLLHILAPRRTLQRQKDNH